MSRGPGHIEQAIGLLFERQRENLGKVVWVSVEVVARVAYGTTKPTHAQRVAIRRAMHAFVRRHYHFELDGGLGRTSLHVAGLAGEKPVPRTRRPGFPPN